METNIAPIVTKETFRLYKDYVIYIMIHHDKKMESRIFVFIVFFINRTPFKKINQIYIRTTGRRQCWFFFKSPTVLHRPITDCPKIQFFRVCTKYFRDIGRCGDKKGHTGILRIFVFF